MHNFRVIGPADLEFTRDKENPIYIYTVVDKIKGIFNIFKFLQNYIIYVKEKLIKISKMFIFLD